MTLSRSIAIAALVSISCSSAQPQAGTHVVQIDFGDLVNPPGNWVLVPLTQQGNTLPNLVDFGSGQPTPFSLTTAMWSVAGIDAKNWTAGDVDWLLAVVAQDAFGGSAQNPSTVAIDNLDGRYRVEVVCATGFPFATVTLTVNGLTTTVTKKGAPNVDSSAWDPQAQGTNAADWLVWPDVTPINGTITISVQPGLLNAVRLSPP